MHAIAFKSKSSLISKTKNYKLKFKKETKTRWKLKKKVQFAKYCKNFIRKIDLKKVEGASVKDKISLIDIKNIPLKAVVT